jgi:hypothetical protein
MLRNFLIPYGKFFNDKVVLKLDENGLDFHGDVFDALYIMPNDS